jgi:hypothetical protein
MIECVTLQLNATFYRSGETMRWVCILRDPEGNVELDRLQGALRQDVEEAREALVADLCDAMASATYQLHGKALELKAALAEQQRADAAAAKPRKRVTKAG